MSLAFYLARLLSVLVVMAAAQALASAALAHPGHETRVSEAVSNPSDIAVWHQEASTPDDERRVETVGHEVPEPLNENSCNSGCCMSGASCCAPAIANPSEILDAPQQDCSIVRTSAAVPRGASPAPYRRPPKLFV